MADKDQYPHLFLGERHRTTSGYTRQQTGRGEDEKTARDRPSHAAKIVKGLTAAWDEALESRQAVGTTTPHGLYLEFEVDIGFEVPVSTLDARSKGVELRNIRETGDGDQQRSLATVFVPAEQRSYFLKQVQEYANEDTSGGKPKREKFVACLEDIHAAVLESFWTHRVKTLPTDDPEWVEIWLHDSNLELRSEDGAESEVVGQFRELITELGIEEQAERAILKFPERAVVLVRANRAQLAALVAASDTLAEIRPVAELASFFIEQLTREEQAEFIDDLVERTQVSDDCEIAVSILDGGVNWGHPLLEPVLEEEDCHAVKEEWGTFDHRADGHGTAMAGVAAFGDVQKAVESNSPIPMDHCLESSKLLPPPPEKNPKRLWGEYTSQAISRAEIKPRKHRVICMAVSSYEDMDRGRPSSWSGKIDQVVSGAEDEERRLFVIASGNTEDESVHHNYPDGLLVSSVHNPAQAWNALAVGAFTEKTVIDSDPEGVKILADAGEISPFSSTSHSWDTNRWPIKPEIVLEGGNAFKDGTGFVGEHDDLSVLTTEANFQKYGYFRSFNGTSAASAHAAWMAAKIHALYPEIWPETVRALLVHSAQWTDEMKAQFMGSQGKTDYARLTRVCGYGVPNLTRAISCPRSSLTLIAEAEIQPFDKSDTGSHKITNEMHLYELPWPKSDLLELGGAEVKMKITLSYFIEPSPGAIGWKDRYRYASHGLRFELNRPGEERGRFEKRINRKALEQGESKPKGSAAEFWTIGSIGRDTGSIHSDIWQGRAADLADSNLVAIYPVNGWWKDRDHLNKWNRKTRYSLVISIETQGQELDIYTPVATQIGIATPVPVEVRV